MAVAPVAPTSASQLRVALTDRQLRLVFALNLAAAAVHFAISIAVVALADFSIQPPVYASKLAFKYDSTGTFDGYDLAPTPRAVTRLPVAALILLIELVTAMFHFGNVVVWTVIYVKCLERLCNPLRWLEYAITAGVMAVLVTFAAGQRELCTLILAGGGIGTIQAFGLATEVLNTVQLHGPHTRQARQARHSQHAQHPQHPAWSLPNRWRLSPTLLGAAFFICWGVVVLFTFSFGGGVDCAEWWVTAIVSAEVALFASFALPGTYVYLCRSPVAFIDGECFYIVLSMTSKALLALVVLFGALSQGSFDGTDLHPSTDCLTIDTNGSDPFK